MSEIAQNRRYATTHEWAAKVEDGLIAVGISEYATQELGDLVFIDLPEVGATVTAGESFGEVESVKAVSELNAPISGTVAQINTEIEENLEIISDSPYDEGWIIRIKPDDPQEYAQLLSAKEYGEKLAEEA